MTDAKPAQGWELQRQGRRVRRPDARTVRIGKPDGTLTGFAGLASFSVFTRGLGLGRELRAKFGRLKRRRSVVYPIESQMQLLVDAAVCGGARVFGIESLASDALFSHLAGGFVPSIDTLYDDLRRFDAQALEDLERVMCRHALAEVRPGQFDEVHIDIDTTVTPLFGEQEGALCGHNPKYKGRPSYHPILARIAEIGTIVCARLRPGNTSFGERDIEDVEVAIDRVREAVGPDTIITTRVDAAGDCAAVLKAIDNKGCFFLVKAKQNGRLLGAIAATKHWTTVDIDADGEPSRQVAEIDYRREDWPEDTRFRVFAVRTNLRERGRQTHLWADLDHSVQVYVTNDRYRDADELAYKYDLRAGIEPLIGELKSDFGFGKMPTSSFQANEAAMLLKLLAFNLVRRWVSAKPIAATSWRMGWIRDVCVRVPGRLLRAQGRWQLRLPPRRMLC